MIPVCAVEVVMADFWKEDPVFVQRVNNVWKDNVIWYGARDDGGDQWRVGFWGLLPNIWEPGKKALCFLGYTKDQVIPRMKTYLSFL